MPIQYIASNKLRVRFACKSVANGIKNDSVFRFKSGMNVTYASLVQPAFLFMLSVDEQHYPFNNFELILALIPMMSSETK